MPPAQNNCTPKAPEIIDQTTVLLPVASSQWAKSLLAKLKREQQLLNNGGTAATDVQKNSQHQSGPAPTETLVDLVHDDNDDGTHNSNNNHQNGNNKNAPTTNISTSEGCKTSSTASAQRPTLDHNGKHDEQENGCQSSRKIAALCSHHHNHHSDGGAYGGDITAFVPNSAADAVDLIAVGECAIEHIRSVYKQTKADNGISSSNSSSTDISEFGDEDDDVVVAEDSEVLVQIYGGNDERPCSDLCLSPGADSFEASNRLRRLENRFRDLAFTKKLLLTPTEERQHQQHQDLHNSRLASTATTTTTTQSTTTKISTFAEPTQSQGSVQHPKQQPYIKCPIHQRQRRRRHSEHDASDEFRTPSSSAIDCFSSSLLLSSSSPALLSLTPTAGATAASAAAAAIELVSAASSTTTHFATHNTPAQNHHHRLSSSTSNSNPALTQHQHQQTNEPSSTTASRLCSTPTAAATVIRNVGTTDYDSVAVAVRSADAAHQLFAEQRKHIDLNSISHHLYQHSQHQKHLHQQQFHVQCRGPATCDEFIEPDLICFDDQNSDIDNNSDTYDDNDDNNDAGHRNLNVAASSSVDDSDASDGSEEISHIFPIVNNNRTQLPPVTATSSPLIAAAVAETIETLNTLGTQCTPNSVPVAVATATVQKLLSGDLHTSCEFDVRHLDEYSPQLGRAFECYDELIDSGSETTHSSEDDDDDDEEQTKLLVAEDINNNRSAENNCDKFAEHTATVEIPECQCESSTTTDNMRETGQLRGLLKPPNRGGPTHTNRVVFDETQNKFFDADYIILIREDCPYDEEDEEPCTCGEHEMVRLCCEEGCQCAAYGGGSGAAVNDTRTPQVSCVSVCVCWLLMRQVVRIIYQ